MAKFSVKKPLTVFVAVVAILVLGVVAFTGMTPDLLPNIDMPYVVVVTAWPGSTPEKVEAQVTKPLEQGLATLEHIENITSTSSANASMVVLEFGQDVNMDTVGVDILQQINLIQPYWENTVSTPYILKLNPSMIPVAVAAVRMEGMDTIALSSFVEDELLNKLEGTAGVASISAGGIVEEKLDIVLNAGKIAALDEKIAAGINDGFDEAVRQLDEAKEQLEASQAALSRQQSQMQGMMGQMQGLGDGAGGLDEQSAALKRQLQAQLAEVETQLAAAKQAQAALGAFATATADLQARVSGLTALQANYADLQSRYDTMRTEHGDTAAWDAMSDEDRKNADARYGPYLDDLDAAGRRLAGYGLADPGEIPAALASAGAALTMAMESQAALLDTMGYTVERDAGNAIVPASLAAQTAAAGQDLAQGLATAQSTVDGLNQLLAGIDSGAGQLEEAAKQLETLMTVQVASTAMSFALNSAQLASAMAEADSGLAQIEQARKDALKSADLSSLITMDTLSQILTAQNFAMPVGYVEDDARQQYLVSVGDAFSGLEQVQNLLLADMGVDGVEPVYLRDVADVSISDNADTVYAKIDGADGVLLTFSKQSAYATAAVSDNIAAKFNQLEAEYPGLAFVPLFDQGDYIYMVVNSILENLALGAVFAIIILFLFLKDVRPTFVTLVSIPVSVVFAIVLMYFTGVTLNIISLSGLAVAVGMLVDNSVVVIENIYRLRGKGISAVQAAISGAAQVAGAITSSTLTTVCVFLPIVFVQGLTRQLFTDLALTMGYALVASLVVALTLVPAMSAGLLRNVKERPSPWFDRAMGGYTRLLKWTLGHKALVLGLSVLMLAGSLALTLLRGFTFMPEMSMPQITVDITMPEDTPLEQTAAAADEVAERIRDIEGVQTVGAITSGGANLLGMGMGGGQGGDATDEVTMYVMIDENGRLSGAQVADEIERRTAGMECEVSASGSSMMSVSMLGGSGISIELYGDDTGRMLQAARQVAAALERVPGVAEVDDGVGETEPEIRFVVDKDKAMKEGLTTAQVYMELAKAFATEKSGPSVEFDGETISVRVVGGDAARLTPTYIQYYRFPVTTRGGEEKVISIRDVADIVETETAMSIARTNQRRVLAVSAGVESGHNVSLVTADAQRALAEEALPDGISYQFAGENETIVESLTELMKMLGLGVLLVYFIMVAQFQSLRSPFIVMFTIPLAFTGGLLALLVTGNELSVVALIGMVMLVGVIVNNGIVLVDYINQLRLDGLDRRVAILDAGVTRMRPILMTSLTTILGLLVMAFGRGTGSEMMQPVAIVCIGGLLFGTLLTLFVVPIMYEMMSKKEMRRIEESDLAIVTD